MIKVLSKKKIKDIQTKRLKDIHGKKEPGTLSDEEAWKTYGPIEDSNSD